MIGEYNDEQSDPALTDAQRDLQSRLGLAHPHQHGDMGEGAGPRAEGRAVRRQGPVLRSVLPPRRCLRGAERFRQVLPPGDGREDAVLLVHNDAPPV